MKVLVILPIIGQPFCSKRIDMLIESGFAVRVLAFERKLPVARMPACEIESLGSVSNENYFNRIPVLLRALPRIRAAAAESDIVYCFGIDLALLAKIASLGRSRPVALELADIRDLQTRSALSGRLFRRFDRWLANRLSLISVTAPDFLNVYYREWLGVTTPGLVIENKLEASHVERSKQEMSKIPRTAEAGRITIGYFGLLQSRWSWRVLQELARRCPETHSIVLAGHPLRIDDIEQVAAELANVSFLGSYRSPDDLARLYSSVDLIWGCYSPFDPEDWNLRWARPNRFYEACAYETPLISRDESNDGRVVASEGIGLVMDRRDVEGGVEKLMTVTRADIDRWRANMAALPRSVYTYTDEAQRLTESLHAMGAGAR